MRLLLIVLISFFLFLGVFCDQNGEETRKLKVTLNPQCTNCNNDTLVVHIEADSAVDRIHYIFDFSGKPSVLIAKADLNSSLNIDWTNFQKRDNRDSVTITPASSYSFSTVLDTIAIFNDSKDTSNYSDPSVTEVIKINPHNLNWVSVVLSENNGDNATLEMNAPYNNGSFSLKYTVFGSPAHGVDLPHLFHTSQAIQIDFVADNINYTYKRPRIAIELLMVSDEKKIDGDYKINRIRNLDDEFTPGIFDVYNVVSPQLNDDSKGSYLQYRPVCYNSKYRSVSSSTESRHGNPIEIQSTIVRFEMTLPSAFYGYSIETKVHNALNITFGVDKDNLYSRTDYISFSYLMGIGIPPLEGLSTFVITFAAITLAIPLLVLILGGTYVAVKRYRN